MASFMRHFAAEFIGFLIEIVVLIAILREVRELKRHQSALHSHMKQLISHEKQLAAVRPLMSTLYTTRDEIMDMATSFTREAKQVFALGTISSLVELERHPSEPQADYNERIKAVDARKREYVAATLSTILSGCAYRRIIDFVPRTGSAQDSLELLSNVNFFLRAYDTPGTNGIDLEIYHNAEILKGPGDFHFRCSDRQLVLRVGGHGNEFANAAISITDTRVIEEFRRYYESLLASPGTRRLSYEDLVKYRVLLQAGDQPAIEALLADSAARRISSEHREHNTDSSSA